MRTHIVAFIGKRGSGKTAAAGYLVAQHGFKNVKFADPLKSMLRAAGLSDEEIEGPKKEEPCDLLMGSTPRHAMQTLGTEWGREQIHPDLWTNLWMVETSKYRLVTVDDCRFPNEADVVRMNGGRIVKIVRPNNPYDQGGAAAAHASETLMDSIEPDFVIENSGSFRELNEMVRRAAFE